MALLRLGLALVASPLLADSDLGLTGSGRAVNPGALDCPIADRHLPRSAAERSRQSVECTNQSGNWARSVRAGQRAAVVVSDSFWRRGWGL